MRRHRWHALLLALVLAVTGLAAGPAAVSAAGSAGTASSAAGPARGERTVVVTLVTGDKVVVSTSRDGRRGMDIRPAPGREGVPFVERRSAAGGLSVVPADAAALIASGKLDPRLFDVDTLISHGYADGVRQDLPLIVSHGTTARSKADTRSALAAADATVTRELPSVQSTAVRAEKTGALWAELTRGQAATRTFDPGIEKVWLDGRVRASLDESVPQVGAPAAWQAGFTGEGVKVAVLDTGIDADHPDLAGAVVAAEDFTETGSTHDGNGHGTHVASIITGSGTASGDRYTGVAPDADLLVGKVLDDGGYGTDSAIIAGMEWAVAQGARVVNLSLGGCPTDGSDPMSQSVNTLTEQSGALFAIAAGNHPSGNSCAEAEDVVSAPAVADAALAVGSVTKQDELSGFSNVGPRPGDGAIKPELTAPGQDIVAARAAGTELGDVVDERYTTLSGTSMAAPHVAGAAAILAQQHPSWKADELRSVLMGTAGPHPTLGVFAQGAGRLDVAAAVRQNVLATPAALSMGIARWPHDGDEPVTTTLTYANTGDAAVTLDLAATGTGPDGQPAPDGMFTVTPRTVTLPARGSAQVTVTGDTTLGGPDGHYSGRVTARGGETVVSTPIGITKEVESYDLTVDAVNRSGEPVDTVAGLTNVAAGPPRLVHLPGEPVTLRLPKGRYDLATSIFDGAPPKAAPGRAAAEPTPATLATRPDLVLDKDTAVTLDARKGRRVRAVVDNPAAKPTGYQATWVDNGILGFRVWGGNDPNVGNTPLYATPTAKVTGHPYTFGYLATLGEPLDDGGSGANGIPRDYHLFEDMSGQIPDPPTFTVHDGDLAAVNLRLHSQAVAGSREATFASIPFTDIWDGRLNRYPVTMPSRRLAFYSTGPDLVWDRSLEGDGGGEIAGPLSKYQAGTKYREDWNVAAIGPVATPFFYGSGLFLNLTPFSPAEDGHAFFSDGSGIAMQTTLRRNGTVVGTSDSPDGGRFDIPADRAEFTVTSRATRTVDWSALATRVNTTWKFTAGPFENFARPGVLGIRVGGAFNLRDRAPAGKPFRLDVRAQRADPDTPVSDVRLEASFDDGRTWTPLELTDAGTDRWLADIAHPQSAAFVSLRATGRDSAGASVRQTVIRAYGLSR
ncbi:S8 family serine peptidase [Actinopolymorpha sp. B17G11]|uniref:S8 family peptidase n=1 Tax=Actinopolymorpha sp. B17G11 TaxID=3160861 RepID=UPI0032E3C980